MSKKLLLTGKPGAGKTTVFQKFLQEHSSDCIGFYTREVLENEERVGFELVPVNLPIENGLIAHINFDTPYVVSKYKVDVTHLERIVKETELALQKGKLLIIDEIAPMEEFSPLFKDFIDNILSSEHDVLATIKLDPTVWTDSVKKKFDLPTMTVTPENRNELPAKLTRFFF